VGGMTGSGHRRFLATFYAGRFPGSFARGADFQVDEITGDRRTNGSLASLAGLEEALDSGDAAHLDLAIERILMAHALIAAHGGMPLIYMGDEIGLTNDPSYRDDPALAADGRWMQRPQMPWDIVAQLGDDSAASRLHAGLRAILRARKSVPQLAGDVPTRVLPLNHRALYGVARPHGDETLTALFNLTEHPQVLYAPDAGLDPARPLTDRLSGRPAEVHAGRIDLPPYGRLWLTAAP
jgi:Glycosidases